MLVKDVVGIALALVIVAGLLVAVKNGSGTANVLSAASGGFATDIKAATGQ